MKIDSYSFGSMRVDGRLYQKDLILFPKTILPDWWREEGHVLSVNDLKAIIAYQPEILVVGTGDSGMMHIPVTTREILEKQGIELVDDNTHQAYKLFNDYVVKGRRVAGAFHLTC